MGSENACILKQVRNGRSRSFQSRWIWHQSKARVQLLISRQYWPWSYAAPFQRYCWFTAKNSTHPYSTQILEVFPLDQIADVVNPRREDPKLIMRQYLGQYAKIRAHHASAAVTACHWLPVRQRIVYKLATLVHKCLTGRAPAYIAEYCRQAGTRRPGMRSAGTSMLDVPRTRTILCARSFAVASPGIWNSLPAGIRDPTLSAGTFATLLKTYLFV